MYRELSRHDGFIDADLDWDHDVDGADFELFFPYFRGPGTLATSFVLLPTGGSPVLHPAPDFDGNHKVDLFDVAVLQNSFTGGP